MNTQDCLFCSISSGDSPAHRVIDEPHVVAFLDTSPVFLGHVLVCPTQHADHLLDLPQSDIGPLFSTVQRVAKAVQIALGADGTFVAVNNVVSQSVPHLHVHVIPRRRKDGLRGFFWPRVKYRDPDEMVEVAASIRAALGNWPDEHHEV